MEWINSMRTSAVSLEPRSNVRLGDAGFRFGLEAEYLLVDVDTFRPLSYRELVFEDLNALLESVPTGDLPSCEALTLAPPHRRRMPIYVEGYHLPDPNVPHPELVPKGLEIRTPICSSIGEAVELLGEYHRRLQRSLADNGYAAVSLSYHPTEESFEGPQGSRSADRWRWAQEAMLTYGPDVNLGLPARLTRTMDRNDLLAKINAYAPALVALTVASPLVRGGPWKVHGRTGKSVRTYRRSVAGQSLRFHDDQQGRIEFKSFEMSHRLKDFHAYFLLVLEVLLDDGLRDRDRDQDRVYGLGAVALDGLNVPTVYNRVAEILERAPRTLARWGFDSEPLRPFHDRLATRRVPADEILELLDREQSVPGILRHLATMVPADATSALAS